MPQEKYKIGQFGPDLGLKLNRNRLLIDASFSDATIVVKQASDLGGTLSSAYRYIVDGAVDMGSQSITVPEGGLFIAGLGFGISSLTSSADNYNMFITGATFSGDLFLDGVDTGVTGTNSQVFELDNMNEGPSIAIELKMRTNQSTVPNIFVFGKHIGGYTELNNLHMNGTLRDLIQKQGMVYSCDYCGKQFSTKKMSCDCFYGGFDEWGAPR